MHQYQDTKIIDCIAPTGGVVSGVPALVSPFVVIPSATAAVGETFAGQLDGIFPVVKAAGFEATVGAIAYFDFTTDKKLKSTGTPIGRCRQWGCGKNNRAASAKTRAIVLLTPELTAALLATQLIEFTLAPPSGVAASRDYIWTAPDDGEFDEHELYTEGRPSSALGTVVETITNLDGDLNVLTATNVELKAGIVDGTALTPTLSATAANKRFARGAKIQWRITTSNADAVAGAGIAHRVKWHRRPITS